MKSRFWFEEEKRSLQPLDWPGCYRHPELDTAFQQAQQQEGRRVLRALTPAWILLAVALLVLGGAYLAL